MPKIIGQVWEALIGDPGELEQFLVIHQVDDVIFIVPMDRETTTMGSFDFMVENGPRDLFRHMARGGFGIWIPADTLELSDDKFWGCFNSPKYKETADLLLDLLARAVRGEEVSISSADTDPYYDEIREISLRNMGLLMKKLGVC